MLAKAIYCRFEDENKEKDFQKQRCFTWLWTVRSLSLILSLGAWLATLREIREGLWIYAGIYIVIAVSYELYQTVLQLHHSF